MRRCKRREDASCNPKGGEQVQVTAATRRRIDDIRRMFRAHQLADAADAPRLSSRSKFFVYDWLSEMITPITYNYQHKMTRILRALTQVVSPKPSVVDVHNHERPLQSKSADALQ